MNYKQLIVVVNAIILPKFLQNFKSPCNNQLGTTEK